MSRPHPTLVFDGDCGICRYWVDYWQGVTDGRVVYRPYQQAAPDFPGIPLASFRGAIQLVEPDGTVYSGAAATYRVLRYAPGRGAWWWLYAHLPGFAAASERAYGFFARRRGLLRRVTRLLWGSTLEAERYDLVSWLFLRLFGAIYICAFAGDPPRSTLPCRQSLPRLSKAARHQNGRIARLLHRCPCGSDGGAASDTRDGTLPDLFSGRRPDHAGDLARIFHRAPTAILTTDCADALAVMPASSSAPNSRVAM